MSDAHIPIDISLSKLLDWLISRRHCNKDWQHSISIVREKINHAIQDMPEVDEVRELLSGSFINYFNCQRIAEILRETEKDSKNFFGQYSSQRMKDWQEIIRLYQVDSVFLADAAQQLSRTLSYEVPSMKKMINKAIQQREETVHKEEGYVKSSADMKSQYEKECLKLGIDGVHVKAELLALLRDLPEVFNEVVCSLSSLKPVIEFYRTFIRFTLLQDLPESEFLPMIHYILSKGNTTTYEWRTGRVPDVVQEVTPISPLDVDTAVSDDQIDFGDQDEATSVGTSQSNGDFVHVEQGDIDLGDDNISWDISVQDDGSRNGNAIESTDKANGESEEGGANVAKGTDALSILHNATTREMFLNELRELECFLQQRLHEMTIEGDVLLVSIMQSADTTIQKQTVDSVRQFSFDVKKTLASLTTQKLQHLYQLHNSPKYVDRLVDQLNHKVYLADKYLQSKEAVILQRKEAIEEQEKLEPQLELIVRKAKLLQEQIEKDIGSRYKGRPVHLTGINA